MQEGIKFVSAVYQHEFNLIEQLAPFKANVCH